MIYDHCSAINNWNSALGFFWVPWGPLASGELVEAERGSLKQDFYSYQAWFSKWLAAAIDYPLVNKRGYGTWP